MTVDQYGGAASRWSAHSQADGRAERAGPSLRAWILTKLLALLLLFGGSGLLYHVAASDDFRITHVAVTGAQLVPVPEIEQVAAATGLNIFWARREEVAQRLQTISAIQSARVATVLPNRLEIRVVERVPAAAWRVGDTAFLVDADGRVLRATDQDTVLPTMRDLGTRPLQAGERVDPKALGTMLRLAQVLPQRAALRPAEFEYSPDTGVTVVGDTGTRMRFGLDDDLEWKVAALAAIRRDLDRQGQRAELIDVRFKDRPYVR
jgi:cell division septal protein FtsQ